MCYVWCVCDVSGVSGKYACGGGGVIYVCIICMRVWCVVVCVCVWYVCVLCMCVEYVYLWCLCGMSGGVSVCRGVWF